MANVKDRLGCGCIIHPTVTISMQQRVLLRMIDASVMSLVKAPQESR